MKKSTFENRTSKVSKATKGYEFTKTLLSGEKQYQLYPIGLIRTCHTSGSGRFTKNMDYTQDTVYVLKMAGLKEGLDFIVGNDSPRGGLTGNFIKLTSKGKRKMIK